MKALEEQLRGNDDLYAYVFNLCFTLFQPRYDMLIVLRECNVGPSKLGRRKQSSFGICLKFLDSSPFGKQ